MRIATFLKFIIVAAPILYAAKTTWHHIPPLNSNNHEKCGKSYPLVEKFSLLQDRQWRVEDGFFISIKSYKNNLQDGLWVDISKTSGKNKEDLASVISTKTGARNGYTFEYKNGKLRTIAHFHKDLKEGIFMNIKDGYPSLVEVYENGNKLGVVDFWDYGRIQAVRFGASAFDTPKENMEDNFVYGDGQKAFEYIEQNDQEYWVIYSPRGEILLKYPKDNDFCKTQFFKDSQKIDIPIFFDQGEFTEVYNQLVQS